MFNIYSIIQKQYIKVIKRMEKDKYDKYLKDIDIIAKSNFID